MNNNIINCVLGVVNKYNFQYLTDFGDFLKIEYIGNNIEFKFEENFETSYEYRNFVNIQGDIVCTDMEKIIKEIENKNMKLKVVSWDWDSGDYPCVYLEIVRC